MIEEKTRWIRPDNFVDALNIFINDTTLIPVAGTTGILRVKRHKHEGFIDLSKCKLNYIKEDKEKGRILIGAMTTFNEIIEYIKNNSNKNKGTSSFSFNEMLLSSLSSAASHPLRNRITIGGSLYDLPIWSDLVSPLLVTSTKVVYNKDEKMELIEYIENRKKFPHIIKEIEINYDKGTKYISERFSLTNFDYAVFRISMAALEDKENKFLEFKSCISGTKNIIYHDENFDKKFIGINLSDTDKINKILDSIVFGFSSDYRFDFEYKEQVAKTIFLNLVKKISE